MSMKENAVFRRGEDFPFQNLEDQIVLVQPALRAVHLMNGPAARIWELLEKEITLPAIVETLTREYDVPEDQAQREGAAFLGELEENQLVSIQPRKAGK